MKIRIRGNSIRYRLDKADIATLQEQQQVTEITTIGTGTLQFTIHAKAGDPAITLNAYGVELSLPADQVSTWVTTEQVGFKHELPNADGSVLRLKDVARVELGAYSYNSVSNLNGHDGIIVGIIQLSGSNANEIQIAIDNLMVKLSKDFPVGIK